MSVCVCYVVWFEAVFTLEHYLVILGLEIKWTQRIDIWRLIAMSKHHNGDRSHLRGYSGDIFMK